MHILIDHHREDSAIAALARVDALHAALTQIVLEGGDLGGIAAEVARVLGVGVLVTSSDGRERAGAMAEDQRALLVAEDLVDGTGRLRVERIGTSGSPAGAGEVRSLRVAASGVDLARLVCLRPDAPIDSDDIHALERAAAVAALLITREQAVTAVENKYQGDFLRDLFLRRAGDEDYVAEHAETFGWELRRPVVVVVAEIDPLGPDEPPVSRASQRSWQERFAAAWSQVTRSLDPGIPCVDFTSEVVALLPVELGPATTSEGHPGEDVVRRTITAVTGDRGGGRRPFSVGVSRVAAGVDALPEAYAQARRAVEIGHRVHGGASTTFFDQLGLHRLIALVPDPAELHAFTRDVLGPLSHATPEAADLRETLQVLIDTNFNVAEAARTQFFHYNTMRYRVSKLERLLGPLSADPHLRLDVAVALRVLEITT
ncbi:helix-turn-helix domain-containing protein [Nocardioides sp. zg-DK7169]|uniref:PucR family transcriptional regulator n=1 Tax=Nocardioides sp. zg-DK7169 TaxID=2736600 RepID=UPI00155776F0|nr:helix-turn-helix domain-containing protein [Nocardioides sp. zg-DK7169]